MKQKRYSASRQTRGFLMGVVTTLLVLSLSVSAFAAYNQNMSVTYDSYKISVNGQYFTPKDVTGRVVEPFNYQGTIYLPVRAVGEATGYTVTWDQNNKTVFMTMGGGSTGGNQGGSAAAPAVNLVDTIPPYSFEGSGNYYPSTGAKSVTMGGNAYKNAVTLEGAGAFGTFSASFNLGGKYTLLSGVAGTKDGESNAATVNFYGDGVLLKTVDIVKNALPVNFSVDVTGVSNFVIESVQPHDFTTVGVADLKIQ